MEAMEDPGRDWLAEAVGRRYRDCRLDNWVPGGHKGQGAQEANAAMEKALQQSRGYVTNFHEHVRKGQSIVFVGPKGAGKDHLMVGVLRAIVEDYQVSTHRVRYIDGLSLFGEFRDTIKGNATETSVVERHCKPHLLAISDPLPPTGDLSDYEQRMMLRLIDKRYRDCRPMAATINASSREEVERRMGPQAADRLLDDAVVVMCNWPSYRQRRNA
jgi:DNA replication protein DnaC